MRTLPVYLIHFDRPDWCASSATTIAGSTGIDVDLTVVDNGSRAGAHRLEQLIPGNRVLTMGENRGYTGAANAALHDWCVRYPAGDYCVIGSHDLHVEPDTFARLV